MKQTTQNILLFILAILILLFCIYRIYQKQHIYLYRLSKFYNNNAEMYPASANYLTVSNYDWPYKISGIFNQVKQNITTHLPNPFSFFYSSTYEGMEDGFTPTIINGTFDLNKTFPSNNIKYLIGSPSGVNRSDLIDGWNYLSETGGGLSLAKIPNPMYPISAIEKYGDTKTPYFLVFSGTKQQISQNIYLQDGEYDFKMYLLSNPNAPYNPNYSAKFSIIKFNTPLSSLNTNNTAIYNNISNTKWTETTFRFFADVSANYTISIILSSPTPVRPSNEFYLTNVRVLPIRNNIGTIVKSNNDTYVKTSNDTNTPSISGNVKVGNDTNINAVNSRNINTGNVYIPNRGQATFFMGGIIGGAQFSPYSPYTPTTENSMITGNANTVVKTIDNNNMTKNINLNIENNPNLMARIYESIKNSFSFFNSSTYEGMEDGFTPTIINGTFDSSLTFLTNENNIKYFGNFTSGVNISDLLNGWNYLTTDPKGSNSFIFAKTPNNLFKNYTKEEYGDPETPYYLVFIGTNHKLSQTIYLQDGVYDFKMYLLSNPDLSYNTNYTAEINVVKSNIPNPTLNGSNRAVYDGISNAKWTEKKFRFNADVSGNYTMSIMLYSPTTTSLNNKFYLANVRVLPIQNISGGIENTDNGNANVVVGSVNSGVHVGFFYGGGDARTGVQPSGDIVRGFLERNGITYKDGTTYSDWRTYFDNMFKTTHIGNTITSGNANIGFTSTDYDQMINYIVDNPNIGNNPTLINRIYENVKSQFSIFTSLQDASYANPMKLPLKEYAIKGAFHSAYNGTNINLYTLRKNMLNGNRFIDLQVFIGDDDKLYVGYSDGELTYMIDKTLLLTDALNYISTYAFKKDDNLNVKDSDSPALYSNYTDYPLFLNLRIYKQSSESTANIIEKIYTECFKSNGIFSSNVLLKTNDNATQINSATLLNDLMGKIIVVMDINNILMYYTKTSSTEEVPNEVKENLEKMVNIKTGGHTWKSFFGYWTVQEQKQMQLNRKDPELGYETNAKNLYIAYPSATDENNPDILYFMKNYKIQTVPIRHWLKDCGQESAVKMFNAFGKPFVPMASVLVYSSQIQ